ncbi:MAG: UDP-N-acetylglucosamine--N-acetylmuramyl-(pentapeptide) pyrophosphoryl-undecaprenol N-acetylglucosamine transferase [Myxococcota bacterium]|jgi:UDP-N-acetylglucosamine--N-acetylmuramyl-(pentapeptide) pyrophosphoryl-undecaprenol N-acetylglucosamine transferase
MKKTIIITTGGTGGHIFPAQVLAKKLAINGSRVIILGDKNYAKYHDKESSYQFKIISSAQLQKSPLKLLLAGWTISLGVFQSLLYLIRYRPKAIVAFGGYATFPILVAAIILRKKIILHEQNAHLGKVNRILAKFATKIALSYQKTDGILKKFSAKTVFVGNPIRDEILALSKSEYLLPNLNKKNKEVENLGYNVLLASQFIHNPSDNSEVFNILIIGGSGGARIFSDILPKAFFNIRDELKNKISLTQQCRSDDVDQTSKKYQSFGISVRISHFFENMAEEISRAHLIIARSGSSSIAEFSAAKKPMILIPFAKSADNHQLKNAQMLKKSGGAIVVEEKEFTINKVTAELEKLIDNPAILQKMSDNSFSAANLDALMNLTKIIEEC